MDGSRGENEGDMAFGNRGLRFEGGSKGFDLTKEEGVGHLLVGGGVNEECGGGTGRGEEREAVVCNGERLRRRWQRNR